MTCATQAIDLLASWVAMEEPKLRYDRQRGQCTSLQNRFFCAEAHPLQNGRLMDCYWLPQDGTMQIRRKAGSLWSSQRVGSLQSLLIADHLFEDIRLGMHALIGCFSARGLTSTCGSAILTRRIPQRTVFEPHVSKWERQRVYDVRNDSDIVSR